MTNEEKINRLRELERCMPIYTKEDVRDFEALEGGIQDIETLDWIETKFGDAFKELTKESIANCRLMAVSGMSIEELTDAFTNGYRLVGPETFKDDIPDDLRIVPEYTRDQTSWIPVTKRLPDDYDRYLITTDEGRVEMVGYGYTDDLPNEIAFHEWDDEGWQCWKPNVTAWMPLPKPYRSEREEV